MADEMKVSLPDGVVKPIIEAQVVAALSGQERLITEMVRCVLDQKVRDQRTYKDYPFLEYTCRELLTKAIESAVRGWVVAQQAEIEKEVAAQLRRQVRGIATRLVAAVADESAAKWRLSIGVKLGEE